MSKYEKALVVILMGSLWGALELFGADFLRAIGAPNKSAFLFGLGIIILYASKRLVDFAGSVVIMALICGLFKTASTNFYACQFTAVMINGIVFEGSYRIFKNQLDSSPIYRSMAAPVITYVSYALFAFGVIYIMREPNWAGRGMAGVLDFLGTSALIAAVASIVTINIGYLLGGALKKISAETKIGLPATMMRLGSVVVVAAIWIAGQVY
jgi:hypothetical protein